MDGRTPKEISDTIKRVIGREVSLAYPDFNAPFQIHTNASKTHDEQCTTELCGNRKRTTVNLCNS
jgi:hypothetical protein